MLSCTVTLTHTLSRVRHTRRWYHDWLHVNSGLRSISQQLKYAKTETIRNWFQAISAELDATWPKMQCSGTELWNFGKISAWCWSKWLWYISRCACGRPNNIAKNYNYYCDTRRIARHYCTFAMLNVSSWRCFRYKLWKISQSISTLVGV